MASNFEYVQHPRRTLPPPIPARKGPAAAFLPGTFHPINPKNIAASNDQVLLSGWGKLIRWIGVACAILAIMLGINLILDAVYDVGAVSTTQMYRLAQDPIIGVLIGILATAIVQSSTTTTTLTVAAVGAGLVSVPVAIPIIMGANIGTTMTAMLVAFSYVGERREFKKAFTTAAMHMWFNLIVVFFMFIIEILFHPLRTATGALTSRISDEAAGTVPTNEVVSVIFDPIVNFIGMNGLIGSIGHNGIASGLCILIGTLLILISVRVMSDQLRVITAATANSIMDAFSKPACNTRAAMKTNLLSFVLGIGFTLLVTASSVTVASMQPVAVSGTIKRRPVLSVIMGANVATTFTAMFATFAIVGVHGEFAMQAALVHVFLNIIGAALVGLIPQLGRGIIRLSSGTAKLAARSYTLSLMTIISCFIVLPALVLLGYAIVL